MPVDGSLGTMELSVKVTQKTRTTTRPCDIIFGYIFKGLLMQCFSSFLMLQPFDTVTHVGVTHNYKIIFVATS